MSSAKILIATPTSDRKNYILSPFIQTLKRSGHQYMIVDNSRSKNHQLSALMGGSYPWYKTKANADLNANIVQTQNYIRNVFLQSEFTHLAFLESDLLPAPNVFNLLALHDKDVVGHPYFIMKGHKREYMLHASEYIDNQLHAFPSSMEKGFSMCDGRLKKVFSVGLGCVLIKRHVLEAIHFHVDPSKTIVDKTRLSSSDSFFYAECAQNDFGVYCDTSKTIKHYNQNWK